MVVSVYFVWQIRPYDTALLLAYPFIPVFASDLIIYLHKVEITLDRIIFHIDTDIRDQLVIILPVNQKIRVILIVIYHVLIIGILLFCNLFKLAVKIKIL